MEPRRPDRPRESDEEPLLEEDERGAAILRERSAGAHEEQISDDANLREDETPPER